ncbi:hypothetical protein [Kitasatospora sp. NPDC088134]|uniref:hypothetical protein n=1 Tax=Kitasatospora sp. NPDC088134 TaxID=3364071 RepID=UPI003830D3D7
MSQTTTEQNPAAQAQGTHHYILTLQRPIPGGGSGVATSSGTCNVPPGLTRHDVYTQLLANAVAADPQLAGAAVLFFDLQPNRL